MLCACAGVCEGACMCFVKLDTDAKEKATFIVMSNYKVCVRGLCVC